MELKKQHPHGYLYAITGSGASTSASASWCISLLMITATFLGCSCGRENPGVAGVNGEDDKIINRTSFPSDFVFGVGSSAYQVISMKMDEACNVDELRLYARALLDQMLSSNLSGFA